MKKFWTRGLVIAMLVLLSTVFSGHSALAVGETEGQPAGPALVEANETEDAGESVDAGEALNDRRDELAPVPENVPELSAESVPEAVQAGANGTEITFVKKDGTETVKSFNDENEQLALNGTPWKTGRWFLKSYFIGWSENPNYIGEGTGHLFYETYTFKDVKDAGLFESGKPVKLYALYASSGIASSVTNGTKVRINDNVSAEDFVEGGNPVRDENNPDRTIATYKRSDGNYKIKKLDAVFTMNPFAAAAVYKNAWVGALDNTSVWERYDQPGGSKTVIDLHVELDPRIELPDEFDLTFTSYVFRPYKFYSARNVDGTEVAENQDYPYLGVDQAGEQAGYGILNRIVNDKPSTTFRVKSYLINDQGKKVPVHKFILRTRMRVGYDQYGNKIPATMEQIQSDMHLTFTAKNNDEAFLVKSAVAKAIAKENEKESPRDGNALFIRGFIDGRVVIFPLDAIKSEDELLDFVNGETPKQPAVRHQIVQVEKIWDDKDDEAKKRPDFVTVNLLADGKDTKKYLTLRAEDDWKGAFRGLPFSENGKMIRYTVEEIPVKDYTSVITANADGYIITNTFVPEKPTPAPAPEIRMPRLPRVESPIVIPTIPKAGVGR